MNSLLIKKKNELQKKKKGFTLVELIIVIAIIAVLIALAIPKFGTVIENSNQKADMATGKNIATIVAQGIADGNITSGDTAVDSSDYVGSRLDGNIKPKSKNAGSASTFGYSVGSTGNIVVFYSGTGGKEVYPEYNVNVPATP